MKCPVCDKEIKRKDNFKRHRMLHDSTAHKKFKCCHCAYESHRRKDLQRHQTLTHETQATGDNQTPKPAIWRPWEDQSNNGKPNNDHGALGISPGNFRIPAANPGTSSTLDAENSNLNQRIQPLSTVSNYEPTSVFEPEAEEEGADNAIQRDPRIDKLIADNLNRIRTYKKKSKRFQDRYNYMLETGSSAELEGFLLDIFRDQRHPFKLNLSFGFILRNALTGELIYYFASQNNRVFDKPELIQEQSDLKKVMNTLNAADLLEYCRLQRPNTKYVVQLITNAHFYVNKLKRFFIGCNVTLPDYIMNRRSLISFQNDHYGQPYVDNLCFFRCLAYHLEPSHENLQQRTLDLCFFRCLAYHLEPSHENLQQRTLDLFHQFVPNGHPLEYEGVSLEEMPLLEDLFHVNVKIYRLTQTTHPTDTGGEELPGELNRLTEVAYRLFTSRNKYNGPPMCLNLYEGHFSLIVNIRAYVRRWSCKKCDMLFDRLFNVTVHERSCMEETKVKFAGGGFGLKKSIFELLSDHGIVVPRELRFFPFRLAFDFESICIPKPQQEPLIDKQQITAELEPASVSVCSNVPGHTEPKFLLSTGDPQQLISDLYSCIVEISNTSRELLTAQFTPVLEELATYTEEYETVKGELEMRMADPDLDGDDDFEAHEVTEADRREIQELKDRLARLEIYNVLAKRLDSWIGRLVCLGFNTGKFDINLIRKYMFPHFLNNQIGIDQIIKRNNDYLSITTEHALFLDVKNYLAAGISYDKWLKSSDISQTKGFFPYEWFTDLNKLDQTELPPHEQFWSSLKQSNISIDDYQYLQGVWSDNGFETMRDLLQWYNNRDVEPFLQAAQKLYDYWTRLDIDPFKGHAISLPGLALCYLSKEMTPSTILPIFDEKNRHLYYLIRQNIVGGLSIVMHRYHERGLTRLPNGLTPETVISYDCNALYLWALGQPTGTGLMMSWKPCGEAFETLKWEPTHDPDVKARWLEIQARNMDQIFCKEPGFDSSKGEVEWLEWMSVQLGRKVEHKFNGRQKVIVYSSKIRYPVDGYVPELNLVLQYNGCFWHGHGCKLDKNEAESSRARRARTEEANQRISGLGFQLQQKWECEWIEEKKNNAQIQHFLSEHLTTQTEGKRSLTAHQIIDKIKDGSLFGMIECDIEIPCWDQALIDYFEEFPPICKNANISFADIGPHMQEYAENNGYMKTPKRMLINSFWAKRILLSTSIVQWMLKNGLAITRIFQVIEMKPKACFADIRDHIADQRRLADLDPAYKASGENWKTLGNSLYGKAMTNKMKHKDHTIALDASVSQMINDRRFHHMEEVGELAYEVSMDKKTINMDLPLTVALFVYNNAKLRMLEFVYDFLKRYLRPGSYQMVCSDTDSIIAAYERKNIDDLVKTELREEYDRSGKCAFLAQDRHSSRTPGLFKVEMEATGIVSLCSKTYLAWNDDQSTTKVSSKGLSKQTNSYTREDFLNVLQTKEKGSGTNFGFKMVGTTLCQYSQVRDGLAYLYVKRRVADDGINTSALHL